MTSGVCPPAVSLAGIVGGDTLRELSWCVEIDGPLPIGALVESCYRPVNDRWRWYAQDPGRVRDLERFLSPFPKDRRIFLFTLSRHHHEAFAPILPLFGQILCVDPTIIPAVRETVPDASVTAVPALLEVVDG